MKSYSNAVADTGQVQELEKRLTDQIQNTELSLARIISDQAAQITTLKKQAMGQLIQLIISDVIIIGIGVLELIHTFN